MATDVSTAFPWIDLPPNCVLTITLDDAGARITTLNVHGWQDGNSIAQVTPVDGPLAFGDMAA